MRIAVPGASGAPDWITFEPGGQIEFSSAPFPCLSDALRRLVSVRDKVARHLRGFGIELLQTGINPWYKPEEIGLQMDKPRYKAMNKYFSRIGPYGPRMMRQTCTVQVNLDFGSSEDEMAKRYLVSLLVAPFAGATFANSPFVDGANSGVKGFRSKVWLNLDPSRTGVAPVEGLMKSLNRDACVRYYWDFAKKAKVVFAAGADYAVPESGLTWEGWVEAPWLGVSPTLEDFETHLSLLFPEVRPRGFLEQRPVDCQHPAWVAAPAGYYTGLLYDSRARDEAISLLEPFAANIGMVLHKVPEGFRNKDLADTSARLMEIAIAGLDRLPECFRGAEADLTLRRFYDHFTARRRTPADDLIDAVSASGLGLGSFLSLGNR
jgi:glutamate--cysteine ligase